jgi:hypothetical protein
MLFDWLVTGQVVATNPAHAVRGPKHVVKTGKTTVLTGEEARALLDSIDARKNGMKPDRAPELLTKTFLARGKLANLKPLTGVTDIPLVRHDGSLLDAPRRRLPPALGNRKPIHRSARRRGAYTSEMARIFRSNDHGAASISS